MQVINPAPFLKVRPFKDLREMFKQSVALYGNLPAFRFRMNPKGEIITRTYREVDLDIDGFGTGLCDLGLKGKRIAVIGDNSYFWSVAHMSVVNGVGISVPLDKLLPSEEIIALLTRAEVSAVVFDKSFWPIIKEAASRLPELKKLIVMKSEEKDECWLEQSESNSTAELLAFETVVNKGRTLLQGGESSFVQAVIDPNALCSLLFTSGTTSQSKGVMLSNFNMTSDIIALAKVEKFPVGTRMLSILPLHHTFENTCGLLFALYMGACICVCDGLRYVSQNMNEYKIHMIIGVPALFESFYKKVIDSLIKQKKLETVQKMMKILQVLRRAKIDLRFIVFKKIHQAFGGCFRYGICGAAPIDPAIITFFDQLGIRILQGYGLTETSPVIAGCNYKVFVPGTVGLPLGDVTLAIDNQKDFEEGEILAKGPMVMQGYFQDEEATKNVFDDQGWFHTGDVGKIDPKTNCLTITGRLKSMIVLKNGKKVFPEEIEQLITQYDFIKESLIFGDTQEDGSVTISAKFVLDPQILQRENIKEADLEEKLAEVVKEINQEMPGYKGIKNYVYSFQDLIKTTTQKVKRPSEIHAIQESLDLAKVKFRQITGKNIDLLDSVAPVKPIDEVVANVKNKINDENKNKK